LSYDFVFAASYDHGGEVYGDKKTIPFHAQCDALDQFICWWQGDLHPLAVYFIIENRGAIEERCLESFMQICEKLFVVFTAENCSARCMVNVLFYGSKLEQYLS